MGASAYPIPNTDPRDLGNRPGDGPLRAGGKPGDDAVTPASTAGLPSTMSHAAQRQQKELHICRDVAAGNMVVKDATVDYLPQAPGEDGENYRDRLDRSVFLNIFKHTIEGLVGQIFRRDPKLGADVPAQISGDGENGVAGHWENIDNAGTHGDVFLRQIETDALTAGHAGILVDFPNTGGKQTAADESGPFAIRPYWVPIKKDNIISWRVSIEGGRKILTQLVLREATWVPFGSFGEQIQVRFRVFHRDTGPELMQPLVHFELLEVTADNAVITVDHGTYPTQIEIPFAEIKTSGQVDILDSNPPLVDLAYMNIAHYQQWSDYMTSLHKTCVPLLAIMGAGMSAESEDYSPVVVGPNTVLDLPMNAKAEYVSHSGAALGELKQSLDDLKSDMGTLGLAMLAPSKRTAETAQAKLLDKATEDAALTVTARALQDGVERALGFHARYLNLDDGGSIEINKEFSNQSMQADMFTAWGNAVLNAKIPTRLMLAAMQDGELISPDEDIDEISTEMEAQAAAAQDAQQQQMADQLALAQTKAKQPPAQVSGDAKPDGSANLQDQGPQAPKDGNQPPNQ